MEGYSEYTQSALEILRNPQKTMHWYAVPLLLITMYIVTKQLHEKNYKVVLGAFALWGVDIFNEIWNSMICFISGYAPVWGTPAGVGNTSWLLMIGYNIEISFMFLIMGFGMYGPALFTALNNGVVSALISFLRTFVFEIGFVLLLPALFGADAIWYSGILAEITAVAISALFVFWLRDRYGYLPDRESK